MDGGFLLFVLAVAVGIVGGGLAHNYSIRKNLGEVARVAAAVAGFLIGFFLVYVVAKYV